MRFDEARDALLENMQERTLELRQRINLAKTGLEAASPLSVLSRGFSMVIHGKTGKVIRRAEEAEPGDRLFIRPMEGYITALTEKIETNAPGVANNSVQ